MDENRFQGTARDIGGKVQDAVGGLTGDAATQARGKINQAVGQAQHMYGDAVDEVRNYTAAQPVTALMMAAGLGVILGFVLGRS